MKLQLDLDNKTIRIEDKVNLSELYDVLKKLLPQGEWKEFSIVTGTQIVWAEPIIINPSPTLPISPYPWWTNPIITCGTDNYKSLTYSLSNGSYNIEIN